MNIEEVKVELGIGQLSLNEDKNEQGESTGWYSQWFNDDRVRVIMPADAVKAQIAGENPNLGVKAPEVKEGKLGPYTLKTIVAYTADVVL